jgi:hypothetical protein
MVPRLLYIKLGSGSNWADECFEKGIIRFDFSDIPNELFLSKDFGKIYERFETLEYSYHTTSKYLSQIKTIFNTDETTIWITFHEQKMWWCKATKKCFSGENNTKYKKVIGKWADEDINGNVLWESNISGNLTKTKGYRSSLCVPDAAEYAWNKIHAQQSQELIQFEKDYVALKKSTIALIQKLSWQDFELLIDLIFRNAGFQRLGHIGKNNKTIDLSLLHPLNNEKLFVQVKSSTEFSTYQNWKEEMMIKEDEKSSYYFVIHSPDVELSKYEELDTDKFSLWREKEISEMVLRFGLIDWLVQKVA